MRPSLPAVLMLPVVASLLPPLVPRGGAGAQLALVDDLHAGAAVATTAAAPTTAAAATAGEERGERESAVTRTVTPPEGNTASTVTQPVP